MNTLEIARIREDDRPVKYMPVGKRVALVALSLAMATIACGSDRNANWNERPYVVAARYRAREASPDLALACADDFSRMRALGFNTVVVDLPDPAACRDVREAALRYELGCVIGDPDFDVYVESQRWPEGIASVESLAGRYLSTATAADGTRLRLRVDGFSPDATERARNVLTELRRLDPARSVLLTVDARSAPLFRDIPACDVAYRPDWPAGNAVDSQGNALLSLLAQASTALRRHRRMIAIPLHATADSSRPLSTTEWQLTYHVGVASGFTDGLIFAVDRTDLPIAADAMSPAERTALRSLTDRATRWGALLRGSRAQRAQSLRLRSADAAGTVFFQPKRTFLLLFNPDLDRFIRGTVRVPFDLEARRFRRAIHVDTYERFEAGRADISLDVTLRPGGAALWELISVPTLPQAPPGIEPP